MSSQHQYDTIVVPCNNIAPDGHGDFRPTTYQDNDQFGMLGGEMSVIAAGLLREQDLSSTFIFSTGISQKTIARHGMNVPSEAAIYCDAFLTRAKDRRKPVVILEEKSANTHSNLAECLNIIQTHAWQHIAILSLRYRKMRIRALWEFITKAQTATNVDFLVSEYIIMKALPGDHDAIIDEAYCSPEGQKRRASEAKGLRDLQAGKCVVTEFQLSNQIERSSRIR